jgi:hypothetical protein
VVEEPREWSPTLVKDLQNGFVSSTLFSYSRACFFYFIEQF